MTAPVEPRCPECGHVLSTGEHSDDCMTARNPSLLRELRGDSWPQLGPCVNPDCDADGECACPGDRGFVAPVEPVGQGEAVETEMHWPVEDDGNDLRAVFAEQIIAWVLNNGGEAQYVPAGQRAPLDFDGPAIGVRAVNRWAWAVPGDHVVKGPIHADPDAPMTTFRAFTVRRGGSEPIEFPGVVGEGEAVETDGLRNAQRHYEAVGDGGRAYYQFHGWTLSCFTCGWEGRGETKEQAMRHMQDHYDAVTLGTDYRVEVRRG